jgi:hypothetical protein
MLTREEYVKDFKAKLDELNIRIIKIEYKSKTAKEDVKAKLQAKIKYLKEKRDSALSKIHELYNTSGETWQDLKQGTENVINSLKAALSKTIVYFRKIKAI